MKIISIIKGFVTNSSSANYWLDGKTATKPSAEIRIDKAREEYYAQKSRTEQTALRREATSDFLLWASFSVILIIVFLLKKIKK